MVAIPRYRPGAGPALQTAAYNANDPWAHVENSPCDPELLAYAVGMSDTKNPVYLDADLLARVDGLAREAGIDRDEYVEDALRRYLAGQDLVALQREVSGRTNVAFEEALQLVYAERDAVRAERVTSEGTRSQSR